MTDREFANRAMARAIECIAYCDKLNQRLIAAEERQRETDTILEEVLVLLATRFPELGGA